jgi:drug/metabolite transporter (DMT)-like permease
MSLLYRLILIKTVSFYCELGAIESTDNEIYILTFKLRNTPLPKGEEAKNMTRYIPFIFVLLWSTGFVGAKFGLPYAEPFTMLMWRMVFVIPIFILLIIILKRPKISMRDASIQGFIGLLIHGFYLGGVFAAINEGMPTGLTALFVSLNPLLIAIFSSVILDKKVSPREWLGLALGLFGVIVVLYGASSWEGVITYSGIAWLTLSLLGICIGTLLQKRYAQHVDLITGSSYQYGASLVLYLFISLTLETGIVEWNMTFIATLAWLIIALSLIAILLLLYMIRHGEATRVASYFYLVPPFTALQGWLFFDEQWSWMTIAGAILVIGALAMNRPEKNS